MLEMISNISAKGVSRLYTRLRLFMGKNSCAVGVVIVTYNRLEKLKKTLMSYESQSYLPQCIIVVDNASSDGTHSYLQEWKSDVKTYNKYVLRLEENKGGSGGFYEGEKFALGLNLDWVMVGDDDAYPSSDYISGILKYVYNSQMNISVACGSVIENGIFKHRNRIGKIWSIDFLDDISQEEYELPLLNIDSAGYLGLIINVAKMREVGLINKDFFIWGDDVEHVLRLKKVGTIICLPQYKIIHDADRGNESLSWKTYYGHRNKMVIIKKIWPLRFPVVLLISLIKAILCPFRGRPIKEIIVRYTAIWDALCNNLGVHCVYRPGWKP